MHLTRFGKVVVAAAVLTVVLCVTAPSVGLVMAIVLALVGLFALSEGFLSSGTGAGTGHEAFAKVESDRKREALRRDTPR